MNIRSLLTTATFFFTLSLAAQRNVILIIADDLGQDYCGFYENHLDTANMPNLRRLLARGVRFSKAWSNPLCSPTRAGILTGRYSFRTGVGTAVGGGSPVLDTAELTIPKVLNRLAPGKIAKAHIGKWHLHESSPANYSLPNKLGYDHYEGNFAGGVTNYMNWSKVKNGVVSNVRTYASTETVNNAISWLKAQNRPFFLWLAFNAPHSPYHLPPKDLHSYDNLSGTTADIAAKPKSYFKASIEALDHEIGRLFDSLQALQKWDNTDIIFIGDNGNDQQVAQQAGGAKGTLDQQGVEVPFIVSGPSVVSPGRSSDALVNVQDLFATILELLGYNNWVTQVSGAKPVDSQSLIPILKNQQEDVRNWIFTEVFRDPDNADDGKAIRNKDYKLIDFDKGTQQFFQIGTDPTESKDLLSGKMNAEAQSHYNALCGELSKLVGTGGFCNLATATFDIEKVEAAPYVYPNPVSSQLFIHGIASDTPLRILDGTGKVFFQGYHHQLYGLGEWPTGLYFIEVRGKKTSLLKFIKI